MKKKLIPLLLALLLCLLAALPPAAPARAAQLSFVAVNDTIPLTLSGASMPFRSGGELYVPYTVFNIPSLGVLVSYRSGDRTISLYGMENQLTFDLAAGTVLDGHGDVRTATCLTSGGVLFLPTSFCTPAFSLGLSELRSRDGYTVFRFTTGSQVYDDSLFIEKAENLISYRVSQYLAPEAPAESAQEPQPQPPANEPPSQPAVPAPPAVQQPGIEPPADEPDEPPEDEPGEEDPEEEEPEPATVYLAVSGTADAETALAALSRAGQHAAFFLSAAEIAADGPLVRRISASGHILGLRAGPDEVPETALRAANDALGRALHEKSLLALLPAAAETGTVERAYCVLREPETPLSAAEAAQAHGQTVLLLLSGGEVPAALAELNNAGAVLAQPRETDLPPDGQPAETD